MNRKQGKHGLDRMLMFPTLPTTATVPVKEGGEVPEHELKQPNLADEVHCHRYGRDGAKEVPKIC